MTTELHTHTSGGAGWRVMDLAVIGCIGILIGLLLAAVAAGDRVPTATLPDPPRVIELYDDDKE